MKRKLIVLALITVLISVFFLGNIACTAEYPQCYLAIRKTWGGNVTSPEENRAWAQGTAVPIMAEPDPGYEFYCWWSDDADARCAIVQPCAALTTIWMNGDYFIEALFRSTGARTCNGGGLCHVVIYESAGGSITNPGIGGYVYNCGTVLNLTADPDPGYEFICWTGGERAYSDPCAATTSLNVCGNYCVWAWFRPDNCPSAENYVLKINSMEHGDVTEPGEGTFTYKEGAVVKLVATPDINYVFDTWTGDVSNIGLIDNEYYIFMLGDYRVTANFKPE